MCCISWFTAWLKRFCRSVAARYAAPLKPLIGKRDVETVTTSQHRRLKPELVGPAHYERPMPESLCGQ